MKKFLLVMLVIGGLIMIGLSSCASSEVKKGSREDIEQQLDEMKKVYPTKNVEDLFEIFPDGFEIKQTISKRDGYIRLILSGNPQNKTIEGILEKNKDKISVIYKDNHLISSEGKSVSSLWPYKGFIFQNFTISSKILENYDMISKNYIYENGGYSIKYFNDNTSINLFLDWPQDTTFEMRLSGSKDNKLDGYHHSLQIEFKNCRFTESIIDVKYRN